MSENKTEIEKANIKRIKELIIKATKYQQYNWYNWIQNPKKIKYLNSETSQIAGLVCDIKDNFVIAGINATCGSRILRNYVPSYTATAVARLISAGCIVLTKSNLDELGHSGTGLNTEFGNAKNPHNKLYMCGGSSGGAAGLVAAKIVDFSLVSDTGDSARIPALNCGVCGFKPSWGLISRYGLIPYAPSLDTPSIIARSIRTISKVLCVANGFDINDITTISDNPIDYFKNLDKFHPSKLRVLVPKDVVDYTISNSNEYYYHFQKVMTILKKQGVEVALETFINLDLVPIIYQIIANSEAISSCANLTGSTFGNRVIDEGWVRSFRQGRSKYLSIWPKFRWINGAIATNKDNFSSVYQKALKARRKISNDINDLFLKYDIFIIPTNIHGAALLSEAKAEYLSTYGEKDSATHLILGNLAGIPCAVIPIGKLKTNQMPIGLCVYTKRKNDLLCLQFANYLQNLISQIK